MTGHGLQVKVQLFLKTLLSDAFFWEKTIFPHLQGDTSVYQVGHQHFAVSQHFFTRSTAGLIISSGGVAK